MDTFLAPPSSVAELQGLYGSFVFPERLLQKIWLQGEFDATKARTECGLTVEVIHPGSWNQLGGPDFKNARLRLNGTKVTGDIELHLRAEDWKHHGHAHDLAYDQVVLHVVLWNEITPRTLGSGGRQIPVLVLLPLLLYSLEEYAADAAVERLANRSTTRTFEELAALSRANRGDRLHRHALARWEEKVRYFRLRCERLGWSEACHQSALEVLGYRFNRTAMLRVALRWPLPAWRSIVAPVEAALASEGGQWSVQGVRPANRPVTRLQQYAAWTRVLPDWPACWQEKESWSRLWPQRQPTPLAAMEQGSRQIRADGNWREVRRQIAACWCGGALTGSRLDTLICNLLLPAVSLHHGGSEPFLLWFHWYAGDLPPHIVKTLRQLDLLSYRQPLCQGLAQGLLGWWIEHEKAAAKLGSSA